MVSVCLPSDALLQHLPSCLGFSYLGHGVSLHGCSSKVQLLLLTLDEGYVLTATLPDLQCGIASLGPPVPTQPPLLGCGVRGGGQQCQAATAPGAAERSYPTSEVRGGGQRTNPTSKEWWLHRCKKAYRSYPKLKVRRGGAEEIPLIQGKEQQLRCAGAAVKRYPTPKVRETQVRR